MKEREKLELPLEKYLASELSAADQDRVWAKVCARRATGHGAHAHADQRARPDPLRLPLTESLLGQGELTIVRARVWRGVLARVRRPQPRPRLAPFLVFAGLVCAVAVGLLVVKNPQSWRPDQASPQALRRVDGAALGPLETGAQARVIRLSDASEIRLARGTRLEPLQSSSSRFELLLARGSAEFAVTPGGPRRWLVEAGAARVEVVGTVFRVERLPDRVVVSVSRGAVLVRGENVPGWVQKVTAGQRVEVRAHGETQRRSEQAPPQAAPAGSAPTVESMTSAPVPGSEAGAVAAEQPARARRTRPARRSALDRLQGSPRERYEALGAQGFARETAAATSIETLLQLADIARLSGHPRDAVQPLTRALEAFRKSPQAALAAFTLGRVLLDQLYLPEPAAATFERAIALRLPRALLPDCYRRLAEAYDRAGDPEASARANERLRTALAGSAAQ